MQNHCDRPKLKWRYAVNISYGRSKQSGSRPRNLSKEKTGSSYENVKKTTKDLIVCLRPTE